MKHKKNLSRQMLQHFVDMHHDQSFWRQMMTLQKSDEEAWYCQFKDLMGGFALSNLLSDFSFMLEMIQTCAPLFTLVSEGLAGNRNFMKEVLHEVLELLAMANIICNHLNRRIPQHQLLAATK